MVQNPLWESHQIITHHKTWKSSQHHPKKSSNSENINPEITSNQKIIRKSSEIQETQASLSWDHRRWRLKTKTTWMTPTITSWRYLYMAITIPVMFGYKKYAVPSRTHKLHCFVGGNIPKTSQNNVTCWWTETRKWSSFTLWQKPIPPA